MPPLYARPRHAAPRDHGKIRAALVPAVLLASSGTALGGLAAGASADDRTVRVTAAATEVDVRALQAERAAQIEAAESRAARARGVLDQARVAEQARAAEEARLAEQARIAAEQQAAAQQAAAQAAAEAARPKFVRPGVGGRTSGFGQRWGRLHAGIDLAGPWGSPIRAVAEGVVESARNEGGYGMCIRIRHADGTQTVYAHMSGFTVRPGQSVEAGDQIGREGNTGHSTGPHLHFEVRIGGAPINPIPWLRSRGIDV